jgi:predicted translin family RNA/ssDNA-binding protein
MAEGASVSNYSYKITQAAQQSLNLIDEKVSNLDRRISSINKQIADLEMERQTFLEARALYKAEASRIKADGLR